MNGCVARVLFRAVLLAGWASVAVGQIPAPIAPQLPEAGFQDDQAPTVEEPGRYAVRLFAAGHWWWYHVHVPKVYEHAAALPVVLVLHGSGGSGQELIDALGWAKLAEDSAFLVVSPDGLAARPDLEPNFLLNPRLWNSGQHERGRSRGKVDDLGFFDALLADVANRWRIDPRRIYVVGHSNGGAMAFRLAAARPTRFAAMASVAGLCWIEPEPLPRPVPTLLLVGTADPLVPQAGGVTWLPWGPRKSPPVDLSITRWCRALACPATPASSQRVGPDLVRDFGTPENPRLFEFMLLEGHGHGWPGYPDAEPRVGRRSFFGPHTSTMDATLRIWQFLRNHALTR